MLQTIDILILGPDRLDRDSIDAPAGRQEQDQKDKNQTFDINNRSWSVHPSPMI